MERHAKAPSSDSSTRRGGAARAKLFLLLGACLLCALVLLVASAGASKGVLTYFGSSGEGDGQFGSAATNPIGVAVNKTGNGAGADQGDVYAVDNANHRVLQFEEDGAFVRAFGWGVDDGSDAFQVCTSGCQAAATPSVEGVAGALPNPQSVAIDQATGNVYVLDRNDQRIDVYGSDGSFQAAFGYGVDTGAAAVELCTAASTCQKGTAGAAAGQMGAAPIALAIDPTDGGLYVADRSNKRIDHYDVTTTAGTVTAASFSDAFGWDVDTGGLTGAFETCTAACRAGQGTANGLGQFNSNQPVDVAVDSTGAVYAVESLATATNKRRLQKFVPGAGTYTPSEFAPAVLSATANAEAPTNVAIGAADRVFVVKQTPAGATPTCPDGSASRAERRVLELTSSGTLEDTHMACAAISSVSSIAADPNSGRLYLASSTGENRLYVLDTVPAATATMDPVTDATETTATFSGQVNPNGASTGYRFEYSADGGATWTVTTKPNLDLGSGSSTIDVESARTGLLPNTEYRARLVAEHPFNAGRTDSAPVLFTTGAVPPVVTVAASTAGPEDAQLHALVDPRGSSVTSCSFEWGVTTSYGHAIPCVPSPGAGHGPKLVSATVANLQSGTYHFRVLATNSAGTTEGEDRSVEVGVRLPDRRAYEMVSPTDKNGGGVLTDNRRSRAAQQLAPGQPMAFQFSSLAGFAGIEGSGISADYLAVRGADRWRTHAIVPRQEPNPLHSVSLAVDTIYEGELSPDLSQGIFRANPTRELITPDSGPVSRVQNLYLRTDLRQPGPGTYRLQTACPRCLESPPTELRTAETYRPSFAAATDDFSHVLFTAHKPLTADALAAQGSLCQSLEIGCQKQAYESIDGAVGLVGRVPAAGDRCDDDGGPACVAAPTSEIGKGTRYYQPNVISADGSRVLFLTPEAGGAGEGQLYIRFAAHATVRVTASEKAVPDPTQPVQLGTEIATPDLSHLFFSTTEELLDEDEDQCEDLYRYDVAPLDAEGLPDPTVSHLTRISVDREPADGLCANVILGATGFSDDGQIVYFFSGSGRQLVAGAPLAPSGTHTILYAWDHGQTRSIGILSSGLNGGEGKEANGINGPGNSYFGRVTPDGSHLLFPAFTGTFLTGYQPVTCQEGSFFGCRQLYLYDLNADGGRGEVACVSCNPDGTPPTHQTVLDVRAATGAANTTTHIVHALSDDGRYVFFSSREALVPEDTNGVLDAYRYDSKTGQLSLLSSGTSPEPSYFLDASADGTDAFFATAQKLSGWDVDNAYDAYDARVDGGLPEPPAVAAPCTGESCRGSAASAPAPAGAASAALKGTGNSRPRRPRCPKGRRAVKRKGKLRCTKPHRRHRQRHQNRTANHDRRASR